MFAYVHLYVSLFLEECSSTNIEELNDFMNSETLKDVIPEEDTKSLNHVADLDVCDGDDNSKMTLCSEENNTGILCENVVPVSILVNGTDVEDSYLKLGEWNDGERQ